MTAPVTAYVEAVAPLSGRVRLVVLQTPDSYRWRSGQYLAVDLPDKVAYFSIASAFRGEPRLELAVGEQADVLPFSPGSEVTISAPAGQAALPESLSADLGLGARGAFTFIAMGTGVAPLRAAIQEATMSGVLTPMTLLHGVRTDADRLFAVEFEHLSALGRLDYRPVLSQPGADWVGLTGRVQEHLGELPRSADHFGICGSQEMVEEVTAVLRRAGAASIFAQGY